MTEFKPILESIENIDNKLNNKHDDPTLTEIIGEDFVEFFKRSKKYYKQNDDLQLAADTKRLRIFLILEVFIFLIFTFFEVYALLKCDVFLIYNLIVCILLIPMFILDILKYNKAREIVNINTFFAPGKIQFSFKDHKFRHKTSLGLFSYIKIAISIILIILCFLNSIICLDKLGQLDNIRFLILFFSYIYMFTNGYFQAFGLKYNYDSFVMETEDKYLICNAIFRNFRRIDKK